MESLTIYNLKRKKRKTRKNLDAIRKKARQNIIEVDVMKSFGSEKQSKNKISSSKPVINCITSKRLTFRNAIRSDTVSRKMISEGKNNNQAEQRKSLKTNILGIHKQQQKEHVTNVFNANSQNQNINCVSTINLSYDGRCLSKTSCNILFSLSQQSGDSDISEMIQTDQHHTDPVIDEMCCQSITHNENEFYNSLIDELPKYLQQTKSKLILKSDIIDKYKRSLRDLCIDKCKASPLAKYRNSSHVSSNQCLLDYTDYSHQGCFKLESLSSSTISLSSNSSSEQTTLPLSLIVLDSPDYVYYPHRLHQ